MGTLAPFAAHIADAGGSLEGTTLESADFGFGVRELSAGISGSRNGANVEFIKRYDAGQRVHRNPIFYAGVLDADLTLIEGVWMLTERGERLTGGFRMQRGSKGSKAAAKRKAREPLFAGVEGTRKKVVVVPGSRKSPKLPRNRASRWIDRLALAPVGFGTTL
jgi:hypothetical protein